MVWSELDQGSIKARLNAAEAILSNIKAVRSKNKNERIYLIGHSHGGSIIAYFLKHFDKEGHLAQGAIFLSTPFIALKPKNNLDNRVIVYSYLFYLFIQMFIFFLIKLFSETYGVQVEGYYLLLCFNILFGLFVFHCYRSFYFFRKMIECGRSKIDQIIKIQDSCDLPANRYLFVKFSGDEAAVGLSFAQFISYSLNTIVDYVYNIVSKLTIKASKHWLIGNEFPELLSLCLICLWLAFSPSIIGYNFSFEQMTHIAETDKLARIEQLKEKRLSEMEDLRYQFSIFGGASPDQIQHYMEDNHDDPTVQNINRLLDAIANGDEYADKFDCRQHYFL